MRLEWIGAAALALLPGIGSASADENIAWRLFVSDHADPKVTVIDALTGNKLDTFGIDGPASLYRSDSGRTVFAVQGKAGAVTAIASGISLSDHGDHRDIDIEAPKRRAPKSPGKSRRISLNTTENSRHFSMAKVSPGSSPRRWYWKGSRTFAR